MTLGSDLCTRWQQEISHSGISPAVYVLSVLQDYLEKSNCLYSSRLFWILSCIIGIPGQCLHLFISEEGHHSWKDFAMATYSLLSSFRYKQLPSLCWHCSLHSDTSIDHVYTSISGLKSLKKHCLTTHQTQMEAMQWAELSPCFPWEGKGHSASMQWMVQYSGQHWVPWWGEVTLWLNNTGLHTW